MMQLAPVLDLALARLAIRNSFLGKGNLPPPSSVKRAGRSRHVVPFLQAPGNDAEALAAFRGGLAALCGEGPGSP